MLDKLVAGLVTTHLGKYFENVNKEQVKVSLWSGHVRLRDLCFRKDALRAWDTAICVKEGSIEELTVVIPWTRLHSECVVVVVKKVRVVLQQKTVAGYDHEREKQEAYERKVHELNIVEEILRREVFGNEGNVTTSSGTHDELSAREVEGENFVEAQKDATFSARLKANILNNIQLKLEDVIVRYEGCHTFRRSVEKDKESCVGRDYHSISLVLSHFRTYACNERFEPHFTSTRERVLYKKAELENMRVVLNDEVIPVQSINDSHGNIDNLSSCSRNKESLSFEELPFLEISELSKQVVSSLRKPLSTGSRSVVFPFSAVARAQYQPVPYHGELPMTRIDVDMNSLRAVLNREQWLVLRALWREIRNGEEYDVLRQFRPSGSGKLRPSDDPRAWWRYAIQVTLYRIRKLRERHVFVWESYKWLKVAREEYMMLFQRSRRTKLRANWLTTLTQEETMRMRELEMDLPIESIKFARRLAYQRTQIERSNLDTVLEKRRMREQEEKEEKREKMVEEYSSVPITESTSPVVREETSGWWGWVTSSWTRRTEGEDCSTDGGGNTCISPEMEEVLRLVNAERWTEAQRLAIAKEFGISEHEVEDLSDTGGISTRAPGGLKWQLRFHASALRLTLCESMKPCIPFGTLALERLSVAFAYATNRCFDFTLSAEDYLVLSHLAEQLQEEVEEERQECALGVIRVARERFDDSTAAALSVVWRRLRPCSLDDGDAHMMPYELRLKLKPVDCIVNVPFLRACVETLWVPLPLTTTTAAAVVRREGVAHASSALTSLRASPPMGERRRTLLMLVVDREILCDWSICVCGLRLIAAEDVRQATRITLQSLEIRNDPKMKLEKRRRIQALSKTIPHTSTVFGDDSEDWVNNVHVSVEGVTVECCLISRKGDGNLPVVSSTSVAIGSVDCGSSSSSSSSSERGNCSNTHVQWECICTLPHFSMQLKESLMMNRNPDIPLLSTSVRMTEPLQLHCSRWSLSVLCTSFSLISDFCQAMLQRSAMSAETMRNSMRSSSSSYEKLTFYAQLRAVGERYFCEHETSLKLEYERQYQAQVRSLGDLEALHRIEVESGKLTIYHATRSSFPCYLLELHRGHVHIVRDTAEVSIFIESGGVPHECRKGIWEARKILFDKHKFPMLESMILLESLIIQWCHEQEDKMGEIEEVKKAFHILQSSSHTNPCHYIRVNCINSEEAQHFADTLETHAIDDHAFAIPVDPTAEEEEEEEKKKRLEEPCQFVLNVTIPQCTLCLHEENMINNSGSEGIMPVYEVIITGTELSFEQFTNEKVVHLNVTGLSVLTKGSPARVLDLIGSSSGVHSTLITSFQLKERPHPHPARKYINIKVSNTAKLAFSDELLAIIEFLWDIMGIITNQVFAPTVYCSVPWSMEPAALVEERWQRDRRGGRLQRHLMSISVLHCILSLYYPSDKFEVAEGEGAVNVTNTSTEFVYAVNNGYEPMAVVEGSNVSVCWNNTEGCSATQCTVQHPQVTLAHLASGKGLQLVYSNSKNTAETVDDGTLCPNISFSFTIRRELPILSSSNFIANGGPYGYRYTHFLTLSGSHFNALYWNSQLWDLMELCSRGIISRAAAVTWRNPYIAGATVLRWPYPVDIVPITPPFTWCLLHRDVQFSHIHLTLPHEDAHVPSVLWGEVDHLSFCDAVVVHGEQQGSRQEHFVQQTSTLKIVGLKLLGIRKRNNQTFASPPLVKIVTLLNGMNLTLDCSSELFRVGGWAKTLPRVFRIKVSDSSVFHGTTHQFALLFDWLYGNFMKTPWRGHFTPKKTALDPFIFPRYTNVVDSTFWIVEVDYMCFRLHDAPKSYHCVGKKESSFTNYVRTGIDICIVVEGLSMEFDWDPSGGFVSRYNVGEISVWDLDSSKRNRMNFSRHPSEVMHESFRFLWIHPNERSKSSTQEEEEKDIYSTKSNNRKNNNNNNTDSKSRASKEVSVTALYEVSLEQSEKKVSFSTRVGILDITPVPAFLYSLKDSLFSLRVRNAVGNILRWKPRVAGVMIDPPGPEDQDWFTNQEFTLELLNINISEGYSHHQRLMPLFFASIMNIQFRNASEKYGVNNEWSISIGHVDKNGVVMTPKLSEGKIMLRPVIISRYWRQTEDIGGESKKLFQVMKTVSGGLIGYIDSPWILLPLKREIYALREVFVKDGYTQLFWLGTFLEERRAWRMGILCTNPTKRCYKDETYSFLVNFTIKEPSVVVAEDDSIITGNEDVEKGVVYSLGSITINRRSVTPGDHFQVALSAVSVKSLQGDSQYAMEPIEATLSLHRILSGGWEVKVRLGIIAVNVTQFIYELVMHSVVRHFVSTEAEITEFINARRERFYHHRTILPLGDPVGAELNTLHRGNKGVEVAKDEEEEEEEDGLDEEVGGGLNIWIEWESFTLRVLRERVGLFAAVGQMAALYDTLPLEHRQGDDSTTRRKIHVSLSFVKLGIENGMNLLDLQPLSSVDVKEPVSHLLTEPRLLLCLDVCDKDELLTVNLGKCLLFLEKNTIMFLLSTLYEPYRRIVLPEYRVHEIKYIDSDVKLHERLVLSKRRKVKVLRGEYNHITIDGNNCDIHFIDAGSPLLSLAEGLTLRIVNARIFLYGKAIEYYIIAGNGSYVVADRKCNTIIHDVNSPLAEPCSVGSEPNLSIPDSDSYGTLHHSSNNQAISATADGGSIGTSNCNSGSWGETRDETYVSPGNSRSRTNDVFRRIRGKAILLLTLPAVTDEGEGQGHRGSCTTQHSRFLVLQATMSACVEVNRCKGCINETSVFDLSEFSVRCEYRDADNIVVNTTSLVSEWAVSVHMKADAQLRSPLQRRIEISCLRGIEIRLRFGDVSFLWRSILQAREALGLIDSNVFDDLSTGVESSVSLSTPYCIGWSEHGVPEEGETRVLFHLRYLNVDVVDDSTNVDVPLFRGRIENIATPKAMKKGATLKLHVSCDWSIIYYNFTSSSWCPLLEPVSLDIVLRRESNTSLEDVKQRKGFLRAGLHLRAVRLHFSIIVAENLRRLWILKKRLYKVLHEGEQFDGNVGTTTTTNDDNNNNNNNNGGGGSSSGGGGGNIMSSVSGGKAQGISKLEFYTYKIAQRVGQDLHVHFAHDSQHRFPPPSVLRTDGSDVLEFNFPRIEGQELPASQHSLALSFRDDHDIVNVATTGRRLVRVGHGMMSNHVLVDVTVSQGQKLVELRTNIGFENELPFAMDIGGVGVIHPGERLHIPINALRERSLFTPLTGTNANIPCSLGMSYDMLSFLYDQVFLCTSKEVTRERVELGDSACSSASLQKNVFFLLRFGPKIFVGNSNVLDCKGTFEAPFFIINGTPLPIQVGLMYRKLRSGDCSLKKFSDSNYFEHITTLSIAADERCAITQVNPLNDIYMDVFATQANGEAMGRVFGGWRQSQMPVLVHSSKRRNCGHSVTLYDSKGSSIVLHIDYTARAITIWCPFWIVNQTPHSLLVSDAKKGGQVAGIRSDEGIPPVSNAAYIVNSERMEKLKGKAAIYICIGRHSSSNTLKWTLWSDRILVGAMDGAGVVSCALYKEICVSLAYTIDFLGGRSNATRVITFNPRWIIENYTEDSILVRQCITKLGEAKIPALSSVLMAPDESHTIDLSGEGEAANAIQVQLPEDEAKGICLSQWSQPLSIDKLGDRTFNLAYETYIKVQDESQMQDEGELFRLGDDTLMRRSASGVLMVSCYRKSSVMYVVLSKPQQPPHVIENRTRYTVYVKQRDVTKRMTVYPRTTRGFAWEDFKVLPVMKVWAAVGPSTCSRSILINFDPQAVVKRRGQLLQELHLPNGEILFVRVRNLGRMSYAISITTENTIDTFCSLPYFQYFLKLEVDGIHTLFSDEHDEFILLTVKPVAVFFSQGADADGNGDEQTFEFSLRDIQIDDERACAKQLVVTQLVDAKPSIIRFTRRLSRVAPILYITDVVINVSSMEVHLEDSFLFQVMKYIEAMRGALGGKTVGMTQGKLAYFTWMNNTGAPMKKKKHSTDAWKQQVVFMDHILIEQVMISISLYRSPGARNDPIWERIGYLSFLIRSVRDARFVWRRVEQKGVYETLWLLGVSYYSYYKHQLKQQLSNVVHVAGLDMMRGFVTDLLQGYFSTDVFTHFDRTKQRVGRRSEAHFQKDETLALMKSTPEASLNLYENCGNSAGEDDAFVFLSRIPPTPTPTPPPLSPAAAAGVESTHLAKVHKVEATAQSTAGTGNVDWCTASNNTLGRHRRMVEEALRLPWSAFYARVSNHELRMYGIYAVQRFLRSLDYSNSFRMQWQFEDLATGPTAALATRRNNTRSRGGTTDSITTAWEAQWRCGRCAEVNQLRARRLEANSLSALPHPSCGIITWTEFIHHISWSELVQICTPEEVRLYGGLVLRSLAGEPQNVIRVEESRRWILGEEKE